MYIPSYFETKERELSFDLMRRENFAQLITSDEEGLPWVTFLPFMLDEKAGPNGTLIGHMARANQQWRHFNEERLVLVSFMGPHSYVSPRWYETKQAVPTWLYLAVQAYGYPRIIEDDNEVASIMQDLVTHHEKPSPNPWKIEEQNSEYLERMRRGIVAFKIEIERLEGKAKLNQNKSEADRESVYKALSQNTDSHAVTLAEMMVELKMIKGK